MKTAGKIRNAATRLISKGFSDEYIREQAMNGEHNGESMQQIYQKIMADPNVHRVERKEPGVYDLILEKDGKESNIGWVDTIRGVGEISQKGYDQVQDISVVVTDPDTDFDVTEPHHGEDVSPDDLRQRELPSDLLDDEDLMEEDGYDF